MGSVTSPTANTAARELVAKWAKEDFGTVSFNLLSDATLYDLPFETNVSGLINRITTALEATAKSAREAEQTRCHGIALAMAHGEDVSTGRLKAINIAAAIAAQPDAQEGEKDGK